MKYDLMIFWRVLETIFKCLFEIFIKLHNIEQDLYLIKEYRKSLI